MQGCAAIRAVVYRQYSDRQLIVLSVGAFIIAGFEWDDARALISFRRGASKALQLACAGMMLALDPADDIATRKRDLTEQVSEERDFSSEAPAMQAINTRVGSLNMDFGSYGQRGRSKPGRAARPHIHWTAHKQDLRTLQKGVC